MTTQTPQHDEDGDYLLVAPLVAIFVLSVAGTVSLLPLFVAMLLWLR